jgi:hypothetical protein
MCGVRLLLLKDQGAYTESFDISPELTYIYFQLNHTAYGAGSGGGGYR